MNEYNMKKFSYIRQFRLKGTPNETKTHFVFYSKETIKQMNEQQTNK